MDLQYLRYLVQIAQFGSVTKAAEANYITQPALSRILSAMEVEVGAPLFSRQGKKLVLTHYGEIYLKAAEKSLNLLDRAIQDITDFRISSSGQVEVRMNIMPPLFKELCTKFQQTYPDIDLDLSHSGTNSTDFGDVFFYNPPLDIGNRKSKKLLEERFVAVVRSDHPLASETEVTLATLAKYKLMTLNPDGIKKSVLASFFNQALSPRIIEVCTNAEIIDFYMQLNNPVAILPSNYATGYFGDYNLVDIHALKYGLSFNIAWNKDTHSEIVLKFIEFVIDFYQNLSICD